jgi:hypothetical protein
MGKFVETLGGLHNPEIKWTELLTRIQKKIKQLKKHEPDASWKADLQEGMLDCLSTNKTHTGESIGSVNRAWVKGNEA